MEELNERDKQHLKDGIRYCDDEEWISAKNVLVPLLKKYPDNLQVVQTTWFMCANMCLWEECYGQVSNSVLEMTLSSIEEDGQNCVWPWRSLVLPFTPKQQLKIAQSTCNAESVVADISKLPRPKKIRRNPTGPIKVGLFSSDFRNHPCGIIIRNWIRNHDSSRTVLIGFSTENDEDEDTEYTQIRNDLMTTLDEFHDVSKMKDEEIYTLINSKDIDILVDLNGHSGNRKPYVLMQKPALIIAAWMGHPGPMGSKYHDYNIVDKFIAPFPISVNNFEEKLAYMDPSYFVGDHKTQFPHMNFSAKVFTSERTMIVLCGADPIPIDILTTHESTSLMCTASLSNQKSIKIGKYTIVNGATWNGEKRSSWKHVFVFSTRDEQHLPDDKIVFGSFNQLVKLSPEVFDEWMKILQGVENSVLWILEFPNVGVLNIIKYVENRYTKELANRIIPASWIHNREKHLRRLLLADIILDSFPYGGHTTTIDALYANLPVLTCRGETFASSVACSLLNAINMPELVTNSWPEFVQKGVLFGSDKEKLKHLSVKIQKNKPNCKLWDGSHTAKQMEGIFRVMLDKYSNKQNPDHINVPVSNCINRYSLSSVYFGKLVGDGLFQGKCKGSKIIINCLKVSIRNWENVFLEFNILCRLNHPAILNLIGSFWTVDAYFLYEFYAKDLPSLLQVRTLTDKQASRFVFQMISGVAYIHGLNILHRDLKLQNMVIDIHGNLKITGFKNAVKCIKMGEFRDTKDGFLSEDAAPEVQSSRRYSTKSDIFAMGITAFKFFRRGCYYDNMTTGEVINKIFQETTTFPEITQMVKNNPGERPTCLELLTNLQKSTRFFVGECFDENPDRLELLGQETDQTQYRLKVPPVETDESRLISVYMNHFCFDAGKLIQENDDIQVGEKVMVKFGYYEPKEGVVQRIHSDRNTTTVQVLFTVSGSSRPVPRSSICKI